MSINRGEIVKKQIIRSGITKMVIAKRLHITRQTLDNWLKREDLEIEKVVRIGTIIQHDFSKDFRELNDIIEFQHLNQRFPTAKVEEGEMDENISGNLKTYSKTTGSSVLLELETCKAAKEELMDKYVDLLERYNKLLAEITNRKP